MATERPFNPVLLEALELEVDAYITVLRAHFDRGFADLSNHVANWQPKECPSRDEWE